MRSKEVKPSRPASDLGSANGKSLLSWNWFKDRSYIAKIDCRMAGGEGDG